MLVQLRTCLLDGQEQQPVGGQRHAEGATGAGQRSQRGAEPGPPQAHGRLDQGEGGAGAEGVGLEERGGGVWLETVFENAGSDESVFHLSVFCFTPHSVLSQLLQQRTQPAAGALATGGRLSEECVRAEDVH